MKYVGVDVGWAAQKRTNGIAVLDGDRVVTLKRCTRDERDELLRALTDIDTIAIDAPLVDASVDAAAFRPCERTLMQGVFQKRCKPGASHIRGTGRLLRAEGTRVAGVVHGRKVVEAFPNAFLGVAIDDPYPPALTRRGKLKALVQTWRERKIAQRLALPPHVIECFDTTDDREKSAALVCLMTALCADRAVAVGDDTYGHILLPPWELWAPWARAALPHYDAPHATR